MAIAIDDVMLSMSMAPRPHTSPSMSSPPNGSWRPSLLVHRHDVGVAEQAQRGRVGVGALDAGDEAGPTRRASWRSTSRPAPSSTCCEHVGVADLLARLDRRRR